LGLCLARPVTRGDVTGGALDGQLYVPGSKFQSDGMPGVEVTSASHKVIDFGK
jgi:hypothetical protein